MTNMTSKLDKQFSWICKECGNFAASIKEPDLGQCEKCENDNWKKQEICSYREIESNIKYYEKKIENDNILRYFNKGSETDHLFFLNNYIGEKETQIIFSIFEKFTKNKSYKIDIFIERNLELFTPAFTSNLILLAIKYSKNLRIRLFLQYDIATTYQIIQTISGDVYLENFLLFTGDIKKDLFFEQGLRDKTSGSYIRSILITADNFKDYFLYSKNSNEVQPRYIDLLNQYNTKIKNDLKLPKIQSYYKKELDILFKKLESKPLFFKMVLSLLYSNLINWKGEKENWINAHLSITSLEKSSSEISKKRNSIDKLVKALLGIFHYTDSIFPGIYEIAKNTQEHSTNKRGVLSVRIFDAKKIIILKNTNQKKWENYFKSSELRKVQKFLDISIVDDGEEGIFETMYKNIDPKQLSGLAKELGQKPVVDDLRQLNKILKDKTTNISYELYIRLFQLSFSDKEERSFLFQLKKASAGYGLMVFTSNLFENIGCYSVKTYSPERKLTYGFFKDFKEEYSPSTELYNPKGTHYNFIFPVIPKETLLIAEKDYFSQKSPSDEDIFKTLVNYSFEQRKDGETTLPYGINFKKNRVLFKNKHELDAYDFSNTSESVDRSALLRFLAEINLSDGKKSEIIIYNLNYETFSRLIDLLRIIYKYFHKTFWSDPEENSQSILFYCNNSNTKLISAFLLGGKSISALLAVNREMSYYQYVEIPFENKLEKIQLTENVNITQEIKNLLKPPFFKNDHPIFFDMILKATKYHTFFEANVHEVLTKEIK